MCGIAGFSCVEPLTEGTVKEFLDKSWDMMSHRGRHAAGWMCQDENNQLVWDKFGGDPQTLLEEGKLSYPMATNQLAIHNRATTQGSAEQNQNNHPVKFGDVQIMHNGTIVNDQAVMKRVLAEEKYKDVIADNLPTVDSVSIAALVDLYLPDPSCITDAVAEVFFEECDFVRGQWAFMATWDKFPEYQLVARIESSPVILGYTEELDKFVYASESLPCRELAGLIGISKDELEIRTLDPKTMLLFKEGSLVGLWQFSVRGVSRYNRADNVISRNRASDGARHYSYDKNLDWVQKGYPRRATEYTQTDYEGEMMEADLDTISDIEHCSGFADCDLMYVYKKGSSIVYYAFYGEVEVVSENNKILDIFRGDTAPNLVFTSQPTADVSNIEIKTLPGRDLNQQLLAVTTGLSKYQMDQEDRDKLRRQKGHEAQVLAELYGSTDEEITDRNFIPVTSNDLRRGFYKTGFRSEKIKNVTFFENKFCFVHKAWYVAHHKEQLANCPEALDSFYMLLYVFESDVRGAAEAFELPTVRSPGKQHMHKIYTAKRDVREQEVSMELVERCKESACSYKFELSQSPIDIVLELKGLKDSVLS